MGQVLGDVLDTGLLGSNTGIWGSREGVLGKWLAWEHANMTKVPFPDNELRLCPKTLRGSVEIPRMPNTDTKLSRRPVRAVSIETACVPVTSSPGGT